MDRKAIKEIQTYLNYNGAHLVVDGIAGRKTLEALGGLTGVSQLNEIRFSDLQTLKQASRNYPHIKQNNTDGFTVFVGAGHSGVDEFWKYQTAPSKMWKHSAIMHYGNTFFEGYENRIVAEMLIDELTKLNIRTVRLHDPVSDTSPSERGRKVRKYLKAGYYGVAIDLHSNAIDPSTTTKDVKGCLSFSTKGENGSDKFNSFLYEEWLKYFDERWVKECNWDVSGDYEANFAFLREADLGTPDCVAVLEEFGFFTSLNDAKFIMQPETRQKRVKALVGAITKAHAQLF